MEDWERNREFFQGRQCCGISRPRRKEEENAVVREKELRERKHMTPVRSPQECNMVGFMGDGRR